VLFHRAKKKIHTPREKRERNGSREGWNATYCRTFTLSHIKMSQALSSSRVLTNASAVRRCFRLLYFFLPFFWAWWIFFLPGKKRAQFEWRTHWCVKVEREDRKFHRARWHLPIFSVNWKSIIRVTNAIVCENCAFSDRFIACSCHFSRVIFFLPIAVTRKIYLVLSPLKRKREILQRW